MNRIKSAIEKFENNDAIQERLKNLDDNILDDVILKIVTMFSVKLEKEEYNLHQDNLLHDWKSHSVVNRKEVDWNNLNKTQVEIRINQKDFDYWKWKRDQNPRLRKSIEKLIKHKIHEKYPEIIAVRINWSFALIIQFKVN